MAPPRRPSGPMIEPGAFAATLLAAQSGAEWAFATLYRSHHPRLLRYLRAHEPQDSGDIGSELWIDVARNLGGFRGDEDQFRGWLFTIARRRVIDHRRARRRRPADPCPDEIVHRATAPSAEDTAMDAVWGDEAARRIVELLPPDQAEVVLLRVVSGLEVAAVAQITGRRPGAVRVAQHRALRTLARKLGEIGNATADPGDASLRDANAPASPR